MNLIDLISNINEVDEDSIIFLKDLKDYKSAIILSYPESDDNGIKGENGNKYHHPLEVFLAKEFVNDWKSMKYPGSATDPTNKIAIPRDYHRKVVIPWWNDNMRSINKYNNYE